MITVRPRSSESIQTDCSVNEIPRNVQDGASRPIASLRNRVKVTEDDQEGFRAQDRRSTSSSEPGCDRAEVLGDQSRTRSTKAAWHRWQHDSTKDGCRPSSSAPWHPLCFRSAAGTGGRGRKPQPASRLVGEAFPFQFPRPPLRRSSSAHLEPGEGVGTYTFHNVCSNGCHRVEYSHFDRSASETFLTLEPRCDKERITDGFGVHSAECAPDALFNSMLHLPGEWLVPSAERILQLPRCSAPSARGVATLSRFRCDCDRDPSFCLDLV